VFRFLRWGLDTYANLRPTLSLPGVDAITGGGRTNLVIVRELTEGAYPPREGDLAELHRRWPEYRDLFGRELPREGKFSLSVTTEDATRRLARYAARLAAHRRALGVSPGHLTIVTKANVLKQTDGLFKEIAESEGRAAGVSIDHLYVDEAARRLVAVPHELDVIVTNNLFGDILSDVACEAMGGLPVAPSASIGDGCAYFEPVHGSAPDIAGKGIADPSGAMLSGAMLLAYLGFEAEARRLFGAVHSALTKKRGTTAEITAEVIRRLS
jgi:isocitrate/isopropylmalate dehydrogenase